LQSRLPSVSTNLHSLLIRRPRTSCGEDAGHLPFPVLVVQDVLRMHGWRAVSGQRGTLLQTAFQFPDGRALVRLPDSRCTHAAVQQATWSVLVREGPGLSQAPCEEKVLSDSM
ncbi:hypothetical protein PMAYCL1PPCAC_27123, partial [Pristionchus mayeri]